MERVLLPRASAMAAPSTVNSPEFRHNLLQNHRTSIYSSISPAATMNVPSTAPFVDHSLASNFCSNGGATTISTQNCNSAPSFSHHRATVPPLSFLQPSRNCSSHCSRTCNHREHTASATCAAPSATTSSHTRLCTVADQTQRREGDEQPLNFHRSKNAKQQQCSRLHHRVLVGKRQKPPSLHLGSQSVRETLILEREYSAPRVSV